MKHQECKNRAYDGQYWRRLCLTRSRARSWWPSWRSWRTPERACLDRDCLWFLRTATREMARLTTGFNFAALKLRPNRASSFLPISSPSSSVFLKVLLLMLLNRREYLFINLCDIICFQLFIMILDFSIFQRNWSFAVK